jgi:hypothetical protein
VVEKGELYAICRASGLELDAFRSQRHQPIGHIEKLPAERLLGSSLRHVAPTTAVA